MANQHLPSSVIEVNELNFEEEVVRSSLPVLVDVTAPWCPPCRVAGPIVQSLAERYRAKLKVVAIDGDASPRLAARLNVRGFPTFLGMAGGEVVERQAGFSGARSLEALAQKIIAPS